MTRDLDVARRILMAVEQRAEPWGYFDLSIDGVDPEVVSYHIKLLAQAGLLEAENMSSLGHFDWAATSLTWEGHEFLDAIRNDTVWKKTKDVVAEKGGGLPFEILKAVSVQFLASMLGVHIP